ncbi:hypothetical protein [Motiliproteus sp. MSK22-1]
MVVFDNRRVLHDRERFDPRPGYVIYGAAMWIDLSFKAD